MSNGFLLLPLESGSSAWFQSPAGPGLSLVFAPLSLLPTPVPISSHWLTLSDPQIQCLLHRESSLPGLGYCPFSCFTFTAPYFASWYLSHLVCIYSFLCLMPEIPLPPHHPDPGRPPVFHPLSTPIPMNTGTSSILFTLATPTESTALAHSGNSTDNY